MHRPPLICALRSSNEFPTCITQETSVRITPSVNAEHMIIQVRMHVILEACPHMYMLVRLDVCLSVCLSVCPLESLIVQSLSGIALV